VSYTIDVFDLAGVEDYENYEFEIGDKTFVQDQEFFGWVQEEIDDPTIPGKKITIKRPYREEVVVNELTEGIDNITKNTLKVQNYKTQFDDLFQRIAATTESLQYNTGRYERGAKVVEPDGSISHKAL
jgi:2',3'-cyclic-nucleotide 2'-phosphodiesterase (5'-nucleotidase family)